MIEAYKFFSKDKDYLKKEQDFLERYCNEFIGWKGLEINSYFRGEKTKQEINEIFQENNANLNEFLENTSKFIDIIKDYSDKNQKYDDDFYTIQRIADFDERHSIDKRIVSDKGFDLSSVNADIKELDDVYDVNDGWTVITYYEKNNGGNGLFIGQFIEDYMNKSFKDFCDWGGFFISLPMQKFERQIIDEDNKIILQTPYRE